MPTLYVGIIQEGCLRYLFLESPYIIKDIVRLVDRMPDHNMMGFSVRLTQTAAKRIQHFIINREGQKALEMLRAEAKHTLCVQLGSSDAVFPDDDPGAVIHDGGLTDERPQ